MGTDCVDVAGASFRAACVAGDPASGQILAIQAALSANHELVQSGPYAWIRHPIYASMLGMLLASGAAYSWWPMLLSGLSFFLIGTEIRVEAEDQLLETYFQDEFIEYRARVRGYIPFIR